MSFDHLFNYLKPYSIDTGGLTVKNFPDSIKRDFIHTHESETIFIFFPAWTNSFKYLKRTKKQVIRSGSSFLAYEFPDAILSDNWLLTKECFGLVNEIIRDEIHVLKNRYGFSRCVLVGVSLGGNYAQMIASNNPDVDELILITTANDLAEALWTGCRTQRLRKSYEKQGISLNDLKHYWHELAPENNLALQGKKISIMLSEADDVIPYSLAKVLLNQMKDKGLVPNITINKYLGHYLTLAYFHRFPHRFIESIV